MGIVGTRKTVTFLSGTFGLIGLAWTAMDHYITGQLLDNMGYGTRADGKGQHRHKRAKCPITLNARFAQEESMARYIPVSTKAGDHQYNVEVRQFDSLDEYREAAKERGENADEALLGILNAAQKQGATQGGKQAVRDALETGDEDAIQKAIAGHQKAAREYIIGAPRGTRNGTGVTKKAQHQFGEAVVAAMMKKGGKPLTQAELTEIAMGLGIDPAALAALSGGEE